MYRITVAILIIIVALQIGSRVVNTRLDYDEGFALQISQRLHNSFSYATYQSYFDSYITTGPTVLIPAAFFITSAYPLLPRIVPVIYAAALMYLCWKYIFTTKRQRIFFLILLNITPLFYYFASHVFGEIPAFTYLLASYIVCTKKKYGLSGICFMLAVLTKSAYVFGIIPLLGAIILTDKNPVPAGIHLFRLAVAAAGVFVIWEGYKLAAFHLNIPLFWSTERYTLDAGQFLSAPAPWLLPARLQMISSVFHVPWFLFTGASFAVAVLVMSRKRTAVTMLAVFSIVYTMYNVLLGPTEWYRHFFPAVLSLSVIVPVFLDSQRSKLLLFALALIAALALYNATLPADPDFRLNQNLNFDNENLFPVLKKDPILTTQFATADFIRNHIPATEGISGSGWWNAPEISYLLGRPIDRMPYRAQNRYLITDMFGITIAPIITNLIRQYPRTTILFNQNSYTIYKKL